ncbi:MAG: hypothetical protein AAF297_06340 [Planctomycetota bacterium]
MKYAVIIAAGAADAPNQDLEGQTPLQIAATPTLDRLARAGRVGTARLTPAGLAPTTDLVIPVLLGVDAFAAGVGPGGVLAAGVSPEPGATELGPDDWGIVADLVSVDDAGQIQPSAAATPEETQALLSAVEAHWAAAASEAWAGCRLHPCRDGRAVMIDRTRADLSAVQTTPPWEALDEPWERHAPTAPGADRSQADRLSRLIESSYDALRDHDVNAARVELGQPPLNAIWLWGPGVFPHMADITVRTGLSVAIIAADPIVRGVAKAINADVLLPSSDDEAGLGQAACDAIDRYDLVIVHADRPASASFAGDPHAKADALRRLDAGVIAPIAAHLETFGDAEAQPDRRGWRVMVAADRYILTDEQRPDPTPVPFAIAGAWVRSVVPRSMTESDANISDLHIDPGHELLEYFLRGGLARVRPVRG